MRLDRLINIKSFYRVTGTPENFLTALRYKVWGFNPDRVIDWKKLTPGDIIFFHSKATDSKFQNQNSAIVGFGVVGNNFYKSEDPLWIDEKIDNKKYPYRFVFSEIYLFADIPINDEWDSTSLAKIESTTQFVRRLVDSGIKLPEGFPHMGGYSQIRNESVKHYLVRSSRELNYYLGMNLDEDYSRTAPLSEIRSDDQTLRYATSLIGLEDIKPKNVGEGSVDYTVDLDLLAKAEKQHFSIISYLKSLFELKGYKVYNNNHIDLFVHNKKKSVLIEAKSIENNNFISQSRKGIVQLFEYNYFEITKFKVDNNIKFIDEHRLLATSSEPVDKSYISFINSCDIKTLAVKDERIIHYGNTLNLKDL